MLLDYNFCQVNIYVQIWKMGHIMEVLKYSQAIQSCSMTYSTRLALFAVKISGKISLKFLEKQDQALYLICFCLSRRFLVLQNVLVDDLMIPVVHVCWQGPQAATVLRHNSVPDYLQSSCHQGGCRFGDTFFFIRTIKIPLQILPPINKWKICFHRQNKENVLPTFLGISDGYSWKYISYSVSR